MPLRARGAVMLITVAIMIPRLCHAQFLNHSFETGDFTNWVTQDVSVPFYQMRVDGSGHTPGFGFFTSDPTDGSFAALHGFDGSPGTIRIAQDVLISGNELMFDHRGAWNLTFGATQERIFVVNIESAGGGTNLASHTILTALPGEVVTDTGDATETIDVSSFIGQTVRVSFDWIVPQNFTGPAFFQLDDVRLNVLADLTAGQLQGTLAQTNFQWTSFRFRELSRRLNGMVGSHSGYSATYAVNATPDLSADASPVQLVGYVQPARQVASRRCCKRQRRASVDGWISGYGIGGNVQAHAGVAGLDYGSGGTQVGLYRSFDRNTVIGLFGGYGHQSVDTDDFQTADIDSGLIGTFLYRGDACGNYCLLAGNASIDTYNTQRQTILGNATGDYDGFQTGVYLERGWAKCCRRMTVLPNVAVQHVWVHQDAHTETGALAASIDESDEHSLRTSVGVKALSASRPYRCGRLAHTWRAHWMHEFLDTSTIVTANSVGTNTSVAGLDLGRDWALLGTGLIYRRGHGNLYGNYDLQLNDRQTFHVGSGGIQWAW